MSVDSRANDVADAPSPEEGRHDRTTPVRRLNPNAAESLFVYDLMTRHPVTLSTTDRLTVASDVMRLGRIRHLAVLDEGGELAGVLSDHDLACGPLLRACGIEPSMEQRILERVHVGEVMARRVSTTTPETPLREAAREMNRRKISCLPVVENDVVVGMLTEHDFVVALVDPDENPSVDPHEGAPPSIESDWQKLERECDRLRTIRDELRVQLQLATMEARDGFELAEWRWAELERHLVQLRSAGGESLEEAARVGRNFVKETKALYEDLRTKFETH